MQPIVTDVPWSLYVCLLDMTMSYAETAEPIEMPFRMWTRVGSRNHVSRRPRSPLGRGNFVGHVPSHWEVQGMSGVSQSYLLGGSSDAACHCSSLFDVSAVCGQHTFFSCCPRANTFVLSFIFCLCRESDHPSFYILPKVPMHIAHLQVINGKFAGTNSYSDCFSTVKINYEHFRYLSAAGKLKIGCSDNR